MNELLLYQKEFELDILKCEAYEDYMCNLMNAGFYESVDAFYEAEDNTKKSVIRKMFDAIKEVLNKVLKFITGKGKEDLEKAKKIAPSIKDKIKCKYNIEEVSKILKDVGNDFNKMDAKKGMSEATVNGIESKLDKIKEFMKKNATVLTAATGVVVVAGVSAVLLKKADSQAKDFEKKILAYDELAEVRYQRAEAAEKETEKIKDKLVTATNEYKKLSKSNTLLKDTVNQRNKDYEDMKSAREDSEKKRKTAEEDLSDYKLKHNKSVSRGLNILHNINSADSNLTIAKRIKKASYDPIDKDVTKYKLVTKNGVRKISKESVKYSSLYSKYISQLTNHNNELRYRIEDMMMNNERASVKDMKKAESLENKSAQMMNVAKYQSGNLNRIMTPDIKHTKKKG